MKTKSKTKYATKYTTKYKSKFAKCLILAAAISMALSSSAFGQQDEKLGKLSFPTSCDPKVQAEFERGVAMLHSYWFLIARRTFEGVLTAGSHLRDGPLGCGDRLARQHAGRDADAGGRGGRLGRARKGAGGRAKTRARARLDRGAERLLPRP